VIVMETKQWVLYRGNPSWKRLIVRWTYYKDFGFYKRLGCIVIRIYRLEIEAGW
jgi:hypothetical protein